MRGRPRKPLGEILGHRTSAELELRKLTTIPAPAGQPKRPAWLNVEERKLWRDLVKHLEQMGTLGACDGPALAALCHELDLYRRAVEITAAEGLILEGRPHPALRIADKALSRIRPLLGEFGLSPADRCRIHAPPAAGEKKPGDEVLAFIGRATG